MSDGEKVAPKGRTKTHLVVTSRRVKGTTVHYVTPGLPVNDGMAPHLLYNCRKRGRPWSAEDGRPTRHNLFFYERVKVHSTVKVSKTDHPQYDVLLLDADKNKIRELTIAEWDAISGGTETKDFKMDVEVKFKNGKMAPLYPARYLARHEARRNRYKQRAPKSKSAAKKKDSRKRAKPSDAPQATQAQQAAMRRTRTMTGKEILGDADICSTLTKAQLMGVLKAASARPAKKAKKKKTKAVKKADPDDDKEDPLSEEAPAQEN